MIFIQFQNNLIQKLSHMKYHCQLINLGYFRGPLHHRGSWMDAETEYDDLSMKTDIILTRFSGAFVTLRFDGASYSETFLGLTSNWAYKPTNAFQADSPGVYTIEKKHGRCWWNLIKPWTYWWVRSQWYKINKIKQFRCNQFLGIYSFL